MKNITALILFVTSSFFFLTSCSKSYKHIGINDNEIIESTIEDNNGNIVNIIAGVSSSYINDVGIPDVANSNIEYVPSIFCDNIGNLMDGYEYIGVDIELTSDIDTSVNVKLFNIEFDDTTGTMQDLSPYFFKCGEYDSPKEAAIVDLDAGVAKVISIGYFCEEDSYDVGDMYLNVKYIDDGERGKDYIKLSPVER